MPLNVTYWWKIWYLLKYFEALTSFNIHGWMTACHIWSGLICGKWCFQRHGWIIYFSVLPLFSYNIRTTGPLSLKNETVGSILHLGFKNHISSSSYSRMYYSWMLLTLSWKFDCLFVIIFNGNFWRFLWNMTLKGR